MQPRSDEWNSVVEDSSCGVRCAWPQRRIQCRKILDQTATEGGVTSPPERLRCARGEPRRARQRSEAGRQAVHSRWLRTLAIDRNRSRQWGSRLRPLRFWRWPSRARFREPVRHRGYALQAGTPGRARSALRGGQAALGLCSGRVYARAHHHLAAAI